MSKYKNCGDVICPFTNNCVLMEENPDAEFPCYMPELPEWMTAIQIYARFTEDKARAKDGNDSFDSISEVAYINPE